MADKDDRNTEIGEDGADDNRQQEDVQLREQLMVDVEELEAKISSSALTSKADARDHMLRFVAILKRVVELI